LWRWVRRQEAVDTIVATAVGCVCYRVWQGTWSCRKLARWNCWFRRCNRLWEWTRGWRWRLLFFCCLGFFRSCRHILVPYPFSTKHSSFLFQRGEIVARLRANGSRKLTVLAARLRLTTALRLHALSFALILLFSLFGQCQFTLELFDAAAFRSLLG
jgi:hypothetical protein